MSDPTLAAVEAVRDDLRALRADLTGRMDQMVTRREHEAEVRRIDAEANRTRDLAHTTRTALEAHEDAAAARLAHIDVSMRDGDAAVLAAITAAEEHRAADRIAARRWTAGWVVTAIGVATALTGLILR